MELKQMKYFKTIVEEGTITQAARVLHISQPPLSMQLKAIEEELDTILIERGHRHITLTPAGHLFYRRCNQMLNLYEQTSKEVQGAATQILRFGITSSNGYLITHEHMDVFRKKYPKLDIHMKEGTTYEMMDTLLAHEIDIALVRTPFDSTNVKLFLFKPEPMIAVGPSTLVNEKKNHLIDYRDDPVLIHRRYRQFIVDYCLNELQFQPHIPIITDDIRTALVWGSILDQVVIIPEAAIPYIDLNSQTYTKLKDKGLYTSAAFITRKEELSPIIETFISLIIKDYKI